MKLLYQVNEKESYPRMRCLNPSSERSDLAYPNIWTSPDCRNPYRHRRCRSKVHRSTLAKLRNWYVHIKYTKFKYMILQCYTIFCSTVQYWYCSEQMDQPLLLFAALASEVYDSVWLYRQYVKVASVIALPAEKGERVLGKFSS